MTIAAIYARKSTEQNGVADDEKSVSVALYRVTYRVRKFQAFAGIQKAQGKKTTKAKTTKARNLDR